MTKNILCNDLGEAIFLDSDSPPKIFAMSSFDPIVRKAYENYRKTYFPKFSDDKVKVLAVTLTISPRELVILKQNKINQAKYLETKLSAIGIPGIWITEETKHKVKHLHGVLVCHNKEESVLLSTDILYQHWKASCDVQYIKDYSNYSKWVDYCCKNTITPEIDTWIKLTI